MILVQGAATSAAAAPPVQVIGIDGMRFQPGSLVIRQGERVTWANKDFVPHTATHADAFDSGHIGPGGSWSFVALKPGTYNYVCTFHPSMKGVLIVEGKGDAR